MNILLYVVTLLLVLSAITYARWDSFQSAIGLQKGFVHYMGSLEQNSSFDSATEWYHKLKVRKNQTTPKESDQLDPNGSIGRLSFYLFLRQKERTKYEKEHQQLRQVAKRLMTLLYGEQRFYQEMSAKRPQFPDEILDEIQNSADQLPEKEYLRETEGLSNLEFVDKELHNVFYLMMKGMAEPTEKAIPIELKPEKTDTDDEEDHASESKESHSSGGYHSLVDLISVKPVYKVRLFLASRSLLLALFGDVPTVEKILEKRRDIYRELRRYNTEDPEGKKGYPAFKNNLKKQFEEEFSQLGLTPEQKLILDFTVSKTNPQKYE